MADNKVKFLRGTSDEYAIVEKDNDTIYFTTDDGKLYIGDKEISGGAAIHYGTTAYWNSQSTLIGKNNHLYVYTDYTTITSNGQAKNVPNIKTGDGTAYLIDNPFITTSIEDLIQLHINDDIKHITAEERSIWNDKVRCYLSTSDNETVVFTTK